MIMNAGLPTSGNPAFTIRRIIKEYLLRTGVTWLWTDLVPDYAGVVLTDLRP